MAMFSYDCLQSNLFATVQSLYIKRVIKILEVCQCNKTSKRLSHKIYNTPILLPFHQSLSYNRSSGFWHPPWRMQHCNSSIHPDLGQHSTASIKGNTIMSMQENDRCGTIYYSTHDNTKFIISFHVVTQHARGGSSPFSWPQIL